MSEQTEQQYHWFASTATAWGASETRREAIQKAIDFGPSNLRERKDIDINVVKVPLPYKGSTYEISNYIPLVEGVELDYSGPVGDA